MEEVRSDKISYYSSYADVICAKIKYLKGLRIFSVPLKFKIDSPFQVTLRS